MELRQIMHILALADEGNMTRAAEKINITQPALSQTLHQIQDEIGLELFRRDGRNLTLTEDGKFFYQKGNELVEKYEEFQYLLDRRRNLNQTHLRYFTDVVDNTEETMLMYQRFYPEAIFERSYCSQWQAVRKLKSGELDLMLTLRPIEDPDHDLVSEELIEEPVRVLLSWSNPFSDREEISIKELNGNSLILYQNAHSLLEFYKELFRQSGVIIGNIREVYNPLIQVQRNEGFLFIAESSYRSLAKAGRLKGCASLRIRDSYCKRRVYLTYRDGDTRDTLPHDFFAFLRDFHRLAAQDSCLPDQERFEKWGRYGLKEKAEV